MRPLSGTPLAAKAGMKETAADLLALLRTGDPPAIATDENHRIIFWNQGAERLLGRAGRQALGRNCHDLLGGVDPFGNRYCYADCPVSQAARQSQPVQPFEMEVPNGPSGRRLFGVTTLRLPGEGPRSFTLVHFLQPIDPSLRLARIVAHLGGAPRDAASPASRVSDVATTQTAGGEGALTEREREVLGCVAAGLQNKEIAGALDISVSTARNHVHRILEKLGVHSKLEALALGMRHGWAASLPAPRSPQHGRPALAEDDGLRLVASRG